MTLMSKENRLLRLLNFLVKITENREKIRVWNFAFTTALKIDVEYI